MYIYIYIWVCAENSIHHPIKKGRQGWGTKFNKRPHDPSDQVPHRSIYHIDISEINISYRYNYRISIYHMDRSNIDISYGYIECRYIIWIYPISIYHMYISNINISYRYIEYQYIIWIYHMDISNMDISNINMSNIDEIQ